MRLALALSSSLRLAEPEVPEVIAPAPATISWAAPAECPSQDEVVASIAERVEPGLVQVRAVVRRELELVADVEIDSAHGSTRRRLQSPSCASIVEALALLAQVAAEPLPTRERIAPAPPEPVPAPAPSPAPPIATPPTVIADVPVVPPPPRQRRPRLRARLFASAVVGGGTLPDLDAGVRGGAGLTSRWVHADVGALYLGERSVRDLPPDVAVTVDAWGLFTRVCPVVPLPTERIELSLCAIATAGRLRGESSGAALQSAASDWRPWVRIAAGPELGIVVHPRVRVVAGVEAGGHITRPGFRIGRLSEVVWRPQRWAVHGLAGLEVRLP